MKIAVLGNGFDLAHDLPTKYTDFLVFIQLITQYVNSDSKEELSGLDWQGIHPKLRTYIETTITEPE